MSDAMVGVLLLGLTALGAGCGSSGSSGSGDKKGSEATSAESVGVAECDEYLKKMESCIREMPQESRAAQEQAFKQSRETWRAAASTEQAKEGLKTTCKAALDALAQNPICK